MAEVEPIYFCLLPVILVARLIMSLISAASIANDTFSFNNYGAAPTEAVTGGAVTLTLSDNTKVVFTNLTTTSELDGHINLYNAP